MYNNAKAEKKTRAEVAHVLLGDHIKQLKKDLLWYVACSWLSQGLPFICAARPSEFAIKADTRSQIDLPPSESDEEVSDEDGEYNDESGSSDSDSPQ